MKLYFDKQPVASYDDLLLHYKASEFESPARSTVPLLSLLKHGGEVLKSIVQDFTEAHLEFCVDPVLGVGKPSHTDVMLLHGDQSLAIEAKWTEPRYATVGEWLAQGTNPDNRRAVMTGWLQLLQPHATKQLELGGFECAVYQMVHRAASACAAGREPALAYLQFSPLPDGSAPHSGQLLDDLGHLHDLLGRPEKFPFCLLEVVVKTTAAFEEIRDLPKACPETAEAVKKSLCGGPLFEFEGVRQYAVGGVRSAGAGAS